MSETKFTPGPWGNLSEDESVPDVPCIRIFAPLGKGETEICQVSSFLNYETDEFELREEDIANAHLISCAPELYDLLDECRYNASMPKGLLADIEKVLAKARGES